MKICLCGIAGITILIELSGSNTILDLEDAIKLELNQQESSFDFYYHKKHLSKSDSLSEIHYTPMEKIVYIRNNSISENDHNPVQEKAHAFLRKSEGILAQCSSNQVHGDFAEYIRSHELDSNNENISNLNKLSELGFSEQECAIALAEADNNIIEAAEILLSGRILLQSDFTHKIPLIEPTMDPNFRTCSTSFKKKVINKATSMFPGKSDAKNEFPEMVGKEILNKLNENEIVSLKSILMPYHSLEIAAEIYLECNRDIFQTQFCLNNICK